MTLLSVIQDHCRIHALNIPTSITGSTDTTVQQLYGIANEVLDDLVDQSKFQAITREATFTSIAAEDQGAISAIAGVEGYLWAYPQTFYDRTLRRPLYGPLTEQEWQAIKAIPNPGPFYKFRIWNDHIFLNPAPSTPFSTIAFEYASSYAVNSSGGVAKAAFNDDADVCKFPEKILRKGIMYRWKQIKGLPYQADEIAYWSLVNNMIARDKVKRPYDMACGHQQDLQPGIFVPRGNYPV